jgi:hypothetical protein
VEHFWQIVGIVGGILNIIVIVISGRAAHGITSLRSSLSSLVKSIGHPDPKQVTLRTGATLVQKVETLAHDQEHLVESVGTILVQFQRQQREFFQEMTARLPPTGKRTERDN